MEKGNSGELKMKHFEAESPKQLSKKINAFLARQADIEILDIKYFAKTNIEVLLLCRVTTERG